MTNGRMAWSNRVSVRGCMLCVKNPGPRDTRYGNPRPGRAQQKYPTHGIQSHVPSTVVSKKCLRCLTHQQRHRRAGRYKSGEGSSQTRLQIRQNKWYSITVSKFSRQQSGQYPWRNTSEAVSMKPPLHKGNSDPFNSTSVPDLAVEDPVDELAGICKARNIPSTHGSVFSLCVLRGYPFL